MSLEDRIVALATAVGADVKALLAGGASIAVFAYDERGRLRTTTGLFAVVEGLGLFQYEVDSDEPDDDESCFATSTGRWLLQAASWDLIDSWLMPDAAARDEWDEDEPARVDARVAAAVPAALAEKLLVGTATCSITSVASLSSVAFTGTVAGAVLGDRVIATPPALLESTAAGRLNFYAWVSAANTVTIALNNASASTATTNTAVRTAWPVTVIKQ